MTLHDYDAFGNRVRTSIEGLTFTAAGTHQRAAQIESFEYDGRNLLMSEENGAGHVIERQYDGAGNLRFQVAGAGSAALPPPSSATTWATA